MQHGGLGIVELALNATHGIPLEPAPASSQVSPPGEGIVHQDITNETVRKGSKLLPRRAHDIEHVRAAMIQVPSFANLHEIAPQHAKEQADRASVSLLRPRLEGTRSML
eukprot:7754466-Alexandrium_andersonii.AAC.2